MTTAAKLALGIDLGTGGPKAAVISTEGRILGTGQARVQTELLADGGAEQDPAQVWAAVLTACRQALAGLDSARDVVTVGVCSQYSSIVPVDAAGQPTMNMIVWLDKRAARGALLRFDGGRRVKDGPLRMLRWLRVHGIPPLPSGMDSLSHMRFVKLARPEVYARTAAFLEPMDFVNLRFTGRAAANPCSAFLMLLVDNRRLKDPRYAPQLVAAGGIDRDKLPELLPVSAAVGEVLPAVAAELGLPAGVKVYGAVNDTQAGGVGSCSFAGDHAGLSIGTTSVMVTHVPFKRTDVINELVSMPSPAPGEYFVMAENGIGGRAVEHFLNNVARPSDSFGEPAAADGFAALHAAVARTAPGSGGVLFLPWLGGSMSPIVDERMRGGFINMSLETTREHLGRAVLEGLALNLRWLRSGVERFAKRELSHYVFYGGGATSDPWAQIIADVNQLPVHQVASPQYTPCLGAGLLALHHHGLLAFEDFKRLVPIRAVREPRAEHRARYDELFPQFVRAFKRNRSIFRALNS